MSDFVDNEAMESDGESSSSENERTKSPSSSKSKKKKIISSDEEDEDEDEEKAREEMKGFIADEDEEDGSGGSDGEGRREKKKRHKRRSRSRSDEDIDDEDMELLQENLGIKIKKARKRIKMDSDSGSESDDSRAGKDNDRRSVRSEDDLPDIDDRDGRGGRAGDGDAGGYESEDVDDFIVGDDGQPIKRDRKKKKTHLFQDSARQMAEDIFGVAFDYDEFEDYGNEDYDSEDEEDEEDEDDIDLEDEDRPRKRTKKKKKRKTAKTIFDMYEPEELERRHFTDRDNEIRITDIPERMQLRSIPVTSVPDGSDELEREAQWVFKHGFAKGTVSLQPDVSVKDAERWKGEGEHRVVDKIKSALEFMRNSFLEVPFIVMYRKEYIEGLKINDLWRVYKMDEQWCRLQTRKASLKKLFKQMMDFQMERVMRDIRADMPQDHKQIYESDIEKLDSIETFEELKDREQYFKLYYGQHLEEMQEMVRAKKKDEREFRRVTKKVMRKKPKPKKVIKQKKRKTKMITRKKRKTKTITRKKRKTKTITRKKRKTKTIMRKKRKMKTITNDDGEEMQVTDDEAPTSDEEAEVTDYDAPSSDEEEEVTDYDAASSDEEAEVTDYDAASSDEEVEVTDYDAATSEEELEVTDDEAPTSEEEIEVSEEEEVPKEHDDDEDLEILKKAKKNDPYSLCMKLGLNGIQARFGLTAEQFGENLQDGYQKIDVNQEDMDPEDVACQFVNERVKTPGEVLKAATFMVSYEIARDPLVRQAVRDAFFLRATINVAPTKKGMKEIDESHNIYKYKYLKDKPVVTLENDAWLMLTEAEEQKLITIEVGKHITANDATFAGLIEEATSLFRNDAYTKVVQDWNALRAEAVDIAFTKHLYPMMRKELRSKLTQEAKDGVISLCRYKLRDWLKVGKYQVNFEEEDEDDWDSSHGVRVMGIMYEADQDTSAYGVLITMEGEVGSIIKLDYLLQRVDAFSDRVREEKAAERKKLSDFIEKNRPHVIAVGVLDRSALGVQKEIEGLVKDLVDSVRFPEIRVFLLDDNLAKVYANSTTSENSYREFPNVLRQAVSIGRRMQDPLQEFAQLCGPENEILCLRYHPLQDLLPEEELLEGIQMEFINSVCHVGVDINECVLHNFLSNLVQFVGGLGPRKAAALLKTLRQMQSSQRLENRQQLVTLCHMGPKVLINCAGFIKIDTSSLGDSETYVEVLDGSRIHNEAYEWARKMAVDALEYEEEDDNPANALEEILQNPSKLSELDLDAFAQELERQGFGKKYITLQDIRDELTDMYKDYRDPYAPPEPEELFQLITKETPMSFYKGKLVNARITGFSHMKPEGEELDKAAPVRQENGNWQCPFCGQADFLELTEVWNHFDQGMCPGKARGVKARLENGVMGFISLRNLSDRNVINPSERVRPGQTILARVDRIQFDRFACDLVCKSSALIDRENYWKIPKDDNWDEEAEAKDIAKETKKKEAITKNAYTKRVIVHPSFHNIGYAEAEKHMATMDQGDVIIRPSSKGHDRLTVTWKVAEGVTQHIDVKEEDKENAFSLGKNLFIGQEEFEDLDEIIARFISPMAAHARDVLAFKYYRDTELGKRAKADEMLMADFRAQPNKIHYFMSATNQFPNSCKFMLSYLPKNKPRHEFVTITPDGFRFRGQNHDSLDSMIRWFKKHYREAPPNASVTPGGTGRNTSRTPYNAAGTPGGITPGAMSLATNTPYGTTPGGYNAQSMNTPYTPTANTPFMTPYNNTPVITPKIQSGGRTPTIGGRTPTIGGRTPTIGGRTPTIPPYRGSGTPRIDGSNPPLPPGSGYTPRGQQTPSSRRPAPYPSQPNTPSYGRSPGGVGGGGGRSREQDGWAAAVDGWASGGRRGKTTPGQAATPKGYTGSTTPRYEVNSRNATPRTADGRATPRDSRRTPRADNTPLYDE